MPVTHRQRPLGWLAWLQAPSLQMHTKMMLDKSSNACTCGHPLHSIPCSSPHPDCTPYHCRTREKVNRPQTRRRRDNSDELLDKLRMLRDNLAAAKVIMDDVVRRERRKRDLAVS